jgi:hypothetical protein
MANSFDDWLNSGSGMFSFSWHLIDRVFRAEAVVLTANTDP